MGENGKRLGRTMSYSRRGWLGYLVGGGAIAVALIMALSPAATAASANFLHAPYKGVVSPNNDIYQSGCGKVTAEKKWHFSMKKGVGGSESKGSAASCKKQIAGVGQSSDAESYGGFDLAFSLGKIPATATTVDANITASWAASFTASDGGKSPACNNLVNTYNDSFTEWEWNSFGSFAYQENDSYNGIWYNYSYNTASLPSPFNLNNTTYYYTYHDSSTYASCEAYGNAFAEVYGYLVDTTTGSEQYTSSNSIGSNGEMFDVFVEVFNETDFGCDQYYEWDEGSSYGSNTSTCYSYNTTLTSEVYSYVPTFTSSTGTSSTVSWSNTSSTTGDMTWSGPWASTDHFALVLYVYADVYAYNGWQHGSASFMFNMATLGHGFKLNKIVIS